MRITLPKEYLIRLSRALRASDCEKGVAEMQLNPAEIEHLETKFSVVIESQAAAKTYEIEDSVHKVRMETLNLSVVYSYEFREHRYYGEVSRHKNKQLFCIYLFEGEDTTEHVACDMNIALEYPYGTTSSPEIQKTSYLARLMGITAVKKLMDRHVGIHSGFAQQVSRTRSYVKTSIYGASKTDSEYCDFVFAGHGIGGAIALISAVESVCIAQLADHCDAAFSVYSYGAPRPGNKCFANVVNQSRIAVKRFVCPGDSMVKLPPKSGSSGQDKYVHVCRRRRVGGFGLSSLCSSGTLDTLDTYFRILSASVRLAEATSDLADAAGEVL